MKKAEGRLSSLVMMTLICLAVFVMLGTLTYELAQPEVYNVAEIQEFSGFEDDYYDALSVNNNFTGSQGPNAEGEVSGSGTYEDQIYKKGLKSIFKMPKMFGVTLKSINRGMSDSNIQIPYVLSITIVAILGFLTIVLLVNAFWKSKI